MFIPIGVPVDARYFPRGGVREADVDAIEVFWFAFSSQFKDKGLFLTDDKIR